MDKKAFIELFGNKARQHYSKENILPSLVIAQAILESGYGTTVLSKNYNNYFGLNNYNDSVTKGYGKIDFRVPQEHNGIVTYNIETMCAFNSIDQCLECYYKWLHRDKPQYKALHGCIDYKKCCQLIKESGYATDSSYTTKLVRIIEENHLTDYDALYHIQTGSFIVKNNAIKMAKELQKLGYNVVIKKFKLYYRVQVGAYLLENNAKAMLFNVKNAGYSSAYITEESGTDVVFK